MTLTLYSKRGLPLGLTCDTAHDAVALLRRVKKAETARDEQGHVVCARYHRKAAEALRPALESGALPGQLALPDTGIPSPLPRLVRHSKKESS